MRVDHIYEAEVDCGLCSTTLDAARLCECDDGPLCPSCHQREHVGTWERVVA